MPFERRSGALAGPAAAAVSFDRSSTGLKELFGPLPLDVLSGVATHYACSMCPVRQKTDFESRGQA